MSLMDEARKVSEQHRIENAKKARPKHPTGWEPGINTESGEIVGQFDHPLSERDYSDAFSELLTLWGFDPEHFTIEDDRVEVRTWTVSLGGGDLGTAWYYKAKIIRLRRKTRRNHNPNPWRRNLQKFLSMFIGSCNSACPTNWSFSSRWPLP